MRSRGVKFTGKLFVANCKPEEQVGSAGMSLMRIILLRVRGLGFYVLTLNNAKWVHQKVAIVKRLSALPEMSGAGRELLSQPFSSLLLIQIPAMVLIGCPGINGV